jgi:hypothetical protein
MRSSFVSAIVAPVLALVATQHHLIHMLLITAGIGGAGMSGMMFNSVLRRIMLLVSLLMVALTVIRLMRGHGANAARVVSAVSVVLTLALLMWTTFMYGL